MPRKRQTPVEDSFEQGLLVWRWWMPALELFRLLDESPSQLFPGVVLPQDGHFVSLIRNSVAGQGYHGLAALARPGTPDLVKGANNLDDHRHPFDLLRHAGLVVRLGFEVDLDGVTLSHPGQADSVDEPVPGEDCLRLFFSLSGSVKLPRIVPHGLILHLGGEFRPRAVELLGSAARSGSDWRR